MIFGVQRRAVQLQCLSKACNYAPRSSKFRLEERRRRFTTMELKGIIGRMEEGHHGYFLSPTTLLTLVNSSIIALQLKVPPVSLPCLIITEFHILFTEGYHIQ